MKIFSDLHETNTAILFVRGVMNPEKIKGQIVDAENQLRTAMLRSDVSALDRLLVPELIFANHLGQLLGKEKDSCSPPIRYAQGERIETLRVANSIPW